MIVAISFVCIVAAVYVCTAAVIVRRIRLRKVKPFPISKVDRAVLVLAAMGMVCGAYGRWVEPNWLATSYVQIRSPKIPAGSRAIRIVHFSDLHSEARPRLEPRLVEAVAAAHPDIIVYTGDSINTQDGLPVLRDCMTALARIAPTFVVRGNWDTQNWFWLDLFGQTGVQELNGNAVRMEVAGTPLWIAGLAFGNGQAIKDTVRQIPREEFSIFLHHVPDELPAISAEHIDLYCAGHTHGGQVALPLYGAMITLSQSGKRYEAGLYRENNTWLYVNRGIGMGGGWLPRVRFLSRPELTVIDIRPDTQ